MTSSAGTFTYWTLLGLSPGSDSEQIKNAFKREAKRWHPDVNKNSRNAEERLKWIIEAYKVLSDPKKRFEWEVSGRPTFEIQDFCPNHSPHVQSHPIRDTSPNGDTTFTAGEKLILLLISSLVLILLNIFVL